MRRGDMLARQERMAAHCCVPELDEPFFVLLGRDPQAPGLVEKWAQDRAQVEPGDKAVSAFATAKFMRMWKDAHPERGLSMEAFARIASPSDLPARDVIEVATWMLEHSYTTGHGDTVADMLGELEAQAKERALQPLSQGNSEAVAWKPDADMRAELDRSELVARALLKEIMKQIDYIESEGHIEWFKRITVRGELYLPDLAAAVLAALYTAPPSQPEGVREALDAGAGR